MPKHKRYFQQSSRPYESDKRNDSARHHGSERFNVPSSSAIDNKIAKERLKLAVRDKLNIKDSKDLKTPSLSLDEQIKRADAIASLVDGENGFESKHFVSSRSSKLGSHSSCNINLSDIPLPKNVNSWKDNPKLLIHPKVNSD